MSTPPGSGDGKGPIEAGSDPDTSSAAKAGSDPDTEGPLPDLYPHIVDRADYDPAFDPNAPVRCDVCGTIMHYTKQCRIVCETCGYTRDCSDP